MARRRLGQNFLFDPSILKRIISFSGITPDDTVVEIGPGHGTLTSMLSLTAGKVIAIELDCGLYERLKEKLVGSGNIELVNADALKYDFGEVGDFKVVANIPYYITTPIIFRLIEQRGHLKSMTLMVQKEVAERIVAKSGCKEYGVLSIMIQYYGNTKMGFVVPRGAFRPAPKVDSAVIHIEILDKPVVEVLNEDTFFRIVRTVFSQRRKMLSNSLKPLTGDIDASDILISANIDPKRRPETLSLTEFARLTEALVRKQIRKAEQQDSRAAVKN